MKQSFILAALLAVSASASASWSLDKSVDPMTSATTKIATTTSADVFTLDSPYRGSQAPRLVIVESKKNGLNISVQIQRGQMICDYSLCTMLVRFDEEKPIKWRMAKAADHSSTLLFFENEKAFLAKIKKAKKLTVEMTFFQNGSKIAVFDTTGLEF